MCESPEDEERLLADLTRDRCPRGLRLELDGRYQAMFSYKMKNYALLDNDGRLTITGSGLRSRGLELFQREWMEEMFRPPTQGEPQKIRNSPGDTPRHSNSTALDVRKFMKTETLQDSLDTYREKIKGSRREPGGCLRAGAPLPARVSAGRSSVLLRGRDLQAGQGPRGRQARQPTGTRRIRTRTWSTTRPSWSSWPRKKLPGAVRCEREEVRGRAGWVKPNGWTGGKWLVVVAVDLAMALAALDSTVIGTAMPTVVASLGGLDLFSWIFSVYLSPPQSPCRSSGASPTSSAVGVCS